MLPKFIFLLAKFPKLNAGIVSKNKILYCQWQQSLLNVLMLIIFGLLFSTPTAINARTNTTNQALQLQLDKLHNQINYLISAQNQGNSASLTEQLNMLRGQVETNSYQLQKLNAANEKFSAKLQTLTEKFDSLTQKVSEPSKKELHLRADNAAFEKAKQALLAKHYKTAESQLHSYLKDYYHGEHYSESLYLLGQIYLITGKTDQAYQQFKTIATRYPKSIKIADAQYNLGLLEIAKGNLQQGNSYLNQVLKQYPNTGIALKAKQQIMHTKG